MEMENADVKKGASRSPLFNLFRQFIGTKQKF